jgi:hypothetical protein
MMAAIVPGRPIPRPSARFIRSLVPIFEPLPETPEGGTVYVRDLDVLVVDTGLPPPPVGEDGVLTKELPEESVVVAMEFPTVDVELPPPPVGVDKTLIYSLEAPQE